MRAFVLPVIQYSLESTCCDSDYVYSPRVCEMNQSTAEGIIKCLVFTVL